MRLSPTNLLNYTPFQSWISQQPDNAAQLTGFIVLTPFLRDLNEAKGYRFLAQRGSGTESNPSHNSTSQYQRWLSNKAAKNIAEGKPNFLETQDSG
jgi:hypothetical protein